MPLRGCAGRPHPSARSAGECLSFALRATSPLLAGHASVAPARSLAPVAWAEERGRLRSSETGARLASGGMRRCDRSRCRGGSLASSSSWTGQPKSLWRSWSTLSLLEALHDVGDGGVLLVRGRLAGVAAVEDVHLDEGGAVGARGDSHDPEVHSVLESTVSDQKLGQLGVLPDDTGITSERGRHHVDAGLIELSDHGYSPVR